MMKLSRLADYAVLLMAEFAKHDDMLFSASMLSKTTRLPLATVSKLLKKLLKAELLSSAQGTKGGYRLSRSAYEISIADIISAVDGPIGLTMCASLKSDCALEQLCSVRSGLKRINDIIQYELTKVTLAEIAHPYHFREMAMSNMVQKEHA